MAKTTLNPFATTQVKVMHRRVMQQDLDMYAAISGRARRCRKTPSQPSWPSAW